MAEQDEIHDEQLPLHGAGERLRIAREEKGLSLAQVSSETRIPERHLELIDNGDFDALPARTYAVGFSRSYAKAVGLDPREITEQVRDELGRSNPAARVRTANFEPGDPARVPSRGLAIASVLAVILLIVGGFMFYRAYLAPGASPPPLVAENEAVETGDAAQRQTAATPQQQAQPSGPVTFTATANDVWVRFYDGEGERLHEAIMQEGDEYTIPEGAENPQIWTGRPHELAITIGGRQVPRLSETETVMKDVAISSEALLARGDADIQAAPPGTVPATETSPAPSAAGTQG